VTRPTKPTASVRITGVDVSPYVANVRVARSINQMMGEAVVFLRRDVVNVRELDYSGSVVIAMTNSTDQDAVEDRIFTGTVSSARVLRDHLEVRCFGGFGELIDELLGSFVGQISVPELVYTVVRSSGITEEALDIDGLAALPRELFEVVVPLSGIVVRRRTKVAGIWLLPAGNGAAIVSGLESPVRVAEFESASAYALALVDSERLYDAELSGMSEIATALAWLTVRAHDGGAAVDGTLIDFDRESLLTMPTSADLAAVRGLLSGRKWLRVPSRTTKVSELDLDRLATDPLLSSVVRASDRQAILAWQRAKSGNDILSSVLALWECIEFYAASASVPPLFVPEQIQKLKEALKPVRKGLGKIEGSRLDDLLARLNDPPLMTRLRAALVLDGVPFTDAELAHLWKLRRVRNRAVHGKATDNATTYDVRRAMSFVARILVQRVRATSSRDAFRRTDR